MSTKTPTATEILQELRRLKPQPYRWMVRAAGLSDKQNAALDALGLPERGAPTRYLPEGSLAIIFEGYPVDPTAKATLIVESLTPPPPLP